MTNPGLRRLHGRLANTLRTAQRALAAGDEACIVAVRGYVEQVRVALEFRDVHECAVLVDEILAFCGEDKAAKPLKPSLKGAIQAALSQLHDDVDDLCRRGISPAPQISVINDLRSFRGLPYLTENPLFPVTFRRITTGGAAEPSPKAIRRLRAEYQKGLVGWLRGSRAAISTLNSVTHEMATQLYGHGERQIWLAATNLTDALDEGHLRPSPAVMRLLTQLDRQLRHYGTESGDKDANPVDLEALLRNLLFYVKMGNTEGRVIGELDTSGDLDHSFDLASIEERTKLAALRAQIEAVLDINVDPPAAVILLIADGLWLAGLPLARREMYGVGERWLEPSDLFSRLEIICERWLTDISANGSDDPQSVAESAFPSRLSDGIVHTKARLARLVGTSLDSERERGDFEDGLHLPETELLALLAESFDAELPEASLTEPLVDASAGLAELALPQAEVDTGPVLADELCHASSSADGMAARAVDFIRLGTRDRLAMDELLRESAQQISTLEIMTRRIEREIGGRTKTPQTVAYLAALHGAITRLGQLVQTLESISTRQAGAQRQLHQSAIVNGEGFNLETVLAMVHSRSKRIATSLGLSVVLDLAPSDLCLMGQSQDDLTDGLTGLLTRILHHAAQIRSTDIPLTVDVSYVQVGAVLTFKLTANCPPMSPSEPTVVDAILWRLQGNITVGETSAGDLCVEARLAIPGMMATVVFLEVDQDRYALPASRLDGIAYLDAGQTDIAVTSGKLQHLDRCYDCFRLATLFGDGGAADTGGPVLLLRFAERNIALVVDDVEERQWLLVEPMGALLSNVPWVCGAAITGDGRVAPVLDPDAIFAVAKEAV